MTDVGRAAEHPCLHAGGPVGDPTGKTLVRETNTAGR